MINSFRQYLVEDEKVMYFSFGRMNPPTIGHEKLLDKLASASGRNPYRMYLSQSQDPKKNPLDYKSKVKFARKMFPKHARSILLTPDVKNVMDIANKLYNEGYGKIVMVVGSDRVSEFSKLLNNYNGKKARHGFYNFQDISVISAGDRDPDSEGVDGMSASKMREAASNNDFTKFLQGLPKSMSDKDSRDLFNSVRNGMGLEEVKEFHRQLKLSPVSETREAYVNGNLFEVGDSVIIKESGEFATVASLGSNYIIVESKTGVYRKWLESVEKTDKWYDDQPEWGTPESTKKAKKMTPGQKENKDPCWPGYKQVGTKIKNGKEVPNCVDEKIEVSQDPDIDQKKGSQPATFFKGLKSKSTKSKRDAHFKKMTKKADDDPSAYKPAPGDKTAKTKPSQYTKKFKQMYGEQTASTDAAKERIRREKEVDKEKHDRMMDRARLLDVRKKNRETK